MSYNMTYNIKKSLVWRHLQYCILIWNPYLIEDIEMIENVQRRATKLIQDTKHWKYDDRLNYLGLTRLERRKVRSDLIETYEWEIWYFSWFIL